MGNKLKYSAMICDKMNNSYHYYDRYGNEVHMKRIDYNGRVYREWREWGCKDNTHFITHYYNSENHHQYYTYDDKFNLIHLKKSTGFELWRTYNEDGSVSTQIDSNGRFIDYNTLENRAMKELFMARHRPPDECKEYQIIKNIKEEEG